MELKNQVISLELAKRLKELNCKQESLWWWVRIEKDWFLYLYIKGKDEETYFLDVNTDYKIFQSNMHLYKYCPAYQTRELGEMLPKRYFSTRNSQNKWWCSWINKDHGIYNHIEFANTEAESRGLMYEHLLKERKI